jgi:hypothetical protein
MISIRSVTGTYEVNWLDGKWRDKAGHVWHFDNKKGIFSHPQHGTAYDGQWDIVEDQE